MLTLPSPALAQAVFRSGVDLVHVGVTVIDKKGQPVRGLLPSDFEITEEGAPQRIDYFLEGEHDTMPPQRLGLLMDSSGSMAEDAKFVHTAAIKFLQRMERATDYTLVDFDTEVRVTRFAPDDFPRLVERVRNRKPDGWTAFYDALGVYLDGASLDDGQKILVLYTDGADTRSALNFSDLLGLIRASDVTIYAIGCLKQASASVLTTLRARLMGIAEESGGLAFFPTSVGELDRIYDQIAREIQGRYTLGYASTNREEDGHWRDVQVRLKKPGLKDYKIRAREGYFAPLKQAARP